MKRTPEQEKARRERSARDRALPKCRCGNVASLGYSTCSRCRAIDDHNAAKQRARDEAENRLVKIEEQLATLTRQRNLAVEALKKAARHHSVTSDLGIYLDEALSQIEEAGRTMKGREAFTHEASPCPKCSSTSTEKNLAHCFQCGHDFDEKAIARREALEEAAKDWENCKGKYIGETIARGIRALAQKGE